MAQTASDVAAEEIVVTGTRAEGRDALASWAPIDVVSERELEETGYIDLNRALNFLEPSINFPRAATTASAANTRPITLRGLSPDQTLVLVNGKRVNIPSYRVKEGDVVEVREKSKQLAVLLEAVQLAERDVPDYLEVDHSKMTATFVRTPGLSDVPYPVIMEPNLVIEYYAQN